MALQERHRDDRLTAARHAAGIDGPDPVEDLRTAQSCRAMALRARSRNRLQLERRSYRDGGDVLSTCWSGPSELRLRKSILGSSRSPQPSARPPLRIFFVITIPLAYKGIIAGALLAFLASFGRVRRNDPAGGQYPR